MSLVFRVFLSSPHSFDSVPLPIIKGAVHSNIRGAAAQVIAEITKVAKDFMFAQQLSEKPLF